MTVQTKRKPGPRRYLHQVEGRSSGTTPPPRKPPTAEASSFASKLGKRAAAQQRSRDAAAATAEAAADVAARQVARDTAMVEYECLVQRAACETVQRAERDTGMPWMNVADVLADANAVLRICHAAGRTLVDLYESLEGARATADRHRREHADGLESGLEHYREMPAERYEGGESAKQQRLQRLEKSLLPFADLLTRHRVCKGRVVPTAPPRPAVVPQERCEYVPAAVGGA